MQELPPDLAWYASCVPDWRVNQATGGPEMGKYVIAWLLGVPGIVLVLVYIFFH
jgi:hypothetical protein